MSNVFNSKILVVGAGGLGCELLKNLVLNGFNKISIVDFDKVSISNLNRQFLFGSEDVDRYKSEVAFEYISPWNDSQSSQFYVSRIEDLGLEILSTFDIILSALDSVDSRRWLNAAFFDISRDNFNRVLIDGGSQNLFGHVRAVKPGLTSCIECYLSLFSPEDPFSCSLTDNLKSPEDCIYHSIYLDWELSNTPVEESSHDGILQHIYQSAKKLAETRNIKGVTLDLVDQICNRSIPNISTTNSIVSSLMVNIILNQDSIKDYNFYFYTGDGLTSLSKFNLSPNENCIICQSKSLSLLVSPNSTLKELLLILVKKLNSNSLNISSDKGVIYLDNPKCVRDLYQSRIDMKLRDFNIPNGKLYLTDSTNPSTWVIFLKFSQNH